MEREWGYAVPPNQKMLYNRHRNQILFPEKQVVFNHNKCRVLLFICWIFHIHLFYFDQIWRRKMKKREEFHSALFCLNDSSKNKFKIMVFSVCSRTNIYLKLEFCTSGKRRKSQPTSPRLNDRSIKNNFKIKLSIIKIILRNV